MAKKKAEKKKVEKASVAIKGSAVKCTTVACRESLPPKDRILYDALELIKQLDQRIDRIVEAHEKCKSLKNL